MDARYTERPSGSVQEWDITLSKHRKEGSAETSRASAEAARVKAEKVRAEASEKATENANAAAEAVMAQVNHITFQLDPEDGGLNIVYTE